MSVIAYLIAVLYPTYSSREYTVSFTIARPWKVICASEFACEIKGQSVYFGLVNVIEGKYNYIYRSAYDG